MKTIHLYTNKIHHELVDKYYRKNFDSFYDGMIELMANNHSQKGDSFITCDIDYLVGLLLDFANDISTCRMNEKPYDIKTFITLANFCAMLHGRHEGMFTTEEDFVSFLE